MYEGTHRLWLLAAGALVGYVAVMWTNPVRASLRDGLRCIRRHPQIWLLPASFALAHSVFRLWRHEYEARVIPNAVPALVPWTGWQPPPWSETVAASWLPAIESTAAIFNCIVTTFPLSAVGAALFLVNWRGYQSALYRAFRRRLGKLGGFVGHLGLVVSASAAVCKPVLFGGLPGLNGYFGAVILLRVGEVVDSLSFVFEYLLGVGVQIYVILLAFAWIRGLTFDFDGLRRFALRRFAFVVKWAAVVIVVSGLGINLPLLVGGFQAASDPITADWINRTIHVTRWLLSGGLLLFCSVQIFLIFHNESLARAVRDHFRLGRRYGGHVGWLVSIVAVHFFALAIGDAFVPSAAGSWTWIGATWSLFVYPLMWTVLAGWFVASWVCLFRRCEQDRPDLEELVPF